MNDGKNITSPAGAETRGGERPDEWRGPLPPQSGQAAPAEPPEDDGQEQAGD